jgi:HTH-like domain
MHYLTGSPSECRPTIETSTRRSTPWGDVVGDVIVVTAMIDRFIAASTMPRLSADSARVQDARPKSTASQSRRLDAASPRPAPRRSGRAGRLSAWRAEFRAAGHEGLKSGPAPAEDRRLAEAQRKIGELTMDLDIPRTLGDEIDAPSVSGTLSVSERLDAPPARVCRLAAVSRSAACEPRRRRSRSEPPRRRPGPVGAMINPELFARIRQTIEASLFVGEGHRKIWTRPRRHGVLMSRKRVLRLMCGAGLRAPTRRSASVPPAHDGTTTVAVPNTMWATEATEGRTGQDGRCAVRDRKVAIDRAPRRKLPSRVRPEPPGRPASARRSPAALPPAGPDPVPTRAR